MNITMRLLVKKRFSYFVIGIFFFLGGVEYAVILPTAWFYLQRRFSAPSYMLGILISSFCLSSLFTGPLMGRWSDKMGRTKAIFLFANLFEIIGNVMYFIGLDSWFLVAGRFVAGVGAGVGAPIIADITRITTTKERTAVISMFMAIRQIGLIIGPGCNLFLREINFTIGNFIVDKYSAPGDVLALGMSRMVILLIPNVFYSPWAFMAVLWTILEVLVLFIYWDLPSLHGSILRQTMNYSYRQDSEPQFLPPTPSPSIVPPADTEPIQSTIITTAIITANTEPLYSPCVRTVTPTKLPRRYPSLDVAITSSNEMIESAERFMVAGSADSGPIMFSATPQEEELQIETRRSLDDGVIRDGGGGYGAINGIPTAMIRCIEDEAYIQQQPQVTSDSSGETEPKPALATKLSWNYYYDEYIREEVIAILAVVFIAFFNQTAMEAMITPLTESLLDWGELEVSILYCVAGVEIMLVFFLITFLSRHLHDRTLLLIGYLVVMATIACLLGYLPNAPQHNLGKNLPFVISGVVLDVFGLPFLVVTSTSLYSKVTREETQGFAQGLRGVCGGIGTLLGPLWADSLITHLYLMLGVMLTLMGVALGMLLLSYKHMKERTLEDLGSTASSHSINTQSSPQQTNAERQPLLENRH